METQKKFSKSVGAGIQSLFGSPGRTYCVIEHKTASDGHMAGDRQEIIVDMITLGRDKSCQVSFGNSFPTISRQHASIIRQGNSWLIKHLGKNPTLVNGRPVAKEWYLQNGDEIQLSYEGPKLGFLIPSNPSVKSINLSHRLSLFRQQALRPYKQALTTIALILVFALVASGYFIYKGQKEIGILTENAKKFSGNVDSLQRRLQESDAARQRLESQMEELGNITRNMPTGQVSGNAVPTTMNMDALFPGVYFLYVDNVVVEYNGRTETLSDYKWSGTGFLLTDGRFVTARHVVEPWFFEVGQDQTALALNVIASGGGKVTAHFIAFSPDGTQLQMTSENFACDRNSDEINTETDENGGTVMYRVAPFSAEDWAFARSNRNGIITPVFDISNILRQQQKLHILGYPLGLGATSPTNISPIYGNCIVSSANLQNGYILVTDRNFEQGNSGGPVFVYNESEQKYYAIGIVSAGAGQSTGMIVPISVIQQ